MIHSWLRAELSAALQPQPGDLLQDWGKTRLSGLTGVLELWTWNKFWREECEPAHLEVLDLLLALLLMSLVSLSKCAIFHGPLSPHHCNHWHLELQRPERLSGCAFPPNAFNRIHLPHALFLLPLSFHKSRCQKKPVCRNNAEKVNGNHKINATETKSSYWTGARELLAA